MNILEKYYTYRKTSIKLNNNILKTCLERPILLRSATLLDIAKGNTFEFDTEDETSVLMDFALNDYTVDNKNIVQIYREKIGWKNEIEKDILDALMSSYTSLFRIISISKSESILFLKDILNNLDNEIKLVDDGLSKTAIPGLLIFIRILPFDKFNMTSGVFFAFNGYLENDLLKRYKTLTNNVKSDLEAVRRFVSFHKLSKTDGIEALYV